MTNGSDKAGKPDLELELAKKLDDSNQFNNDQLGEEFSEQQLEEFKQARECLNLLRITLRDQTGSTTNANANVTLHDVGYGTTEESAKAPTDDDTPEPTKQDKLKRIGRFRIEKEIRKGGFGIVLLARDETLDRDVALKIPRAETLLSVDSRKRFEREAKAAGILSHPAIIPIYEYGQVGPISYIAFAYCDGTSLDQWLKVRSNQDQMTAAIPPSLAARVVARLADAVSHAHRRGVIHRDLKPNNILIDAGDSGATGRVEKTSDEDFAQRLRIADFGLALLTGDNENLTVEGACVGTPAYMSPEQTRGMDMDSPAVDIYSLGVILFQLLTGEVPFRGKSNLAIFKAITETPAPSPRKLNRSVPNDLAAICLKCLEKEPNQRYASATDLNDDLVRFLENRPIRARNKSWIQHLQLWAKRNLLLATLSTLLLFSLLIGFGATLQQYGQSQNNLRFAESNFLEAKSTVDELMTKAMSFELAAQPKIRKEMLTTVSRFYQDFITQGQDDSTLDFELAQANGKLGAVEMKMGHHKEAIKFYEAAELIYDDCVTRNSPVEQQLAKISNQIDIGLQYDYLKNLTKSLETYSAATEPLENLLDLFPADPDVRNVHARMLKNTGAVLSQLGKVEESMQHYLQAELVRKQLADDFPDNKYRFSLATVHSSKTIWYIDQRQHQKAIDESEKYRGLIEELLVSEPDSLQYKVQNLRMWNRAGDVYRSTRKKESWHKAVELYQKAEQHQTALANEYPLLKLLQTDLDNTLGNLGQTHAKLGQHELAITKFEEAKRRIKVRLNRDLENDDEFELRLSLAACEHRLGRSHVELQRPEKALSCFDRGLELCEQLLQIRTIPRIKREQIGLLVNRGKLQFTRGEHE